MKLEKFRQEEGLSYAALAELIGLGRARAKDAERYCKGAVPRDDATMVKIVEITKGQVTPNDWYDLPPMNEVA